MGQVKLSLGYECTVEDCFLHKNSQVGNLGASFKSLFPLLCFSTGNRNASRSAELLEEAYLITLLIIMPASRKPQGIHRILQTLLKAIKCLQNNFALYKSSQNFMTASP